MRPGRRSLVYIETEDGETLAADVIAVEVSTTMGLDGLVSSQITMQVLGSPRWMATRDVAREVASMRTAEEWKCTYCGSVNKRAHTHCGYCGATRSFLYG